jgi:hypothetical protein
MDCDRRWMAPSGSFRMARTQLAWSGSGPTDVALRGVLWPSPVLLGSFVGVMRPRDLLNEGLSPAYAAALDRAIREHASALLIAVGCAYLCYRRQVRYGTHRRERLARPLFVLAFGLPGWIGYRFGHSWPLLETCPQCAAAVPRDREECCRCEMEFPRPALKGTEVFA